MQFHLSNLTFFAYSLLVDPEPLAQIERKKREKGGEGKRKVREKEGVVVGRKGNKKHEGRGRGRGGKGAPADFRYV